VDLTGRHSLVTGANQGIGYSTALALAKRGAVVTMVCRSRPRGEAARAAIIKETGNEEVHLRVADLSSVVAAKQVADEYLASGKPLHVLVNNAGCLVNPRAETAEGLEVNFATNTMGTYVLTDSLLPLLRSSAPSRVVTVSSGGQYTEELVTEDLQWKERGGFDGSRQYARDKRRQTALTELWGKDAANAGVTFASMHPGWADTDAVRTSLPQFYEALKAKLRTAEQGADTVLWLCCVPAERLQSGAFYFDRRPTSAHLTLAATGYPAERPLQVERQLRALAEATLAQASSTGASPVECK